MELHKALKEIIAQRGVDMINNIQIINFLLDYQAFKEKPATKLILRDVINSGYAEKIRTLDMMELGWQTKFKLYEHEFINAFGYNEYLAVFVFESIAFALGMNNGINEPQENNESAITDQQNKCALNSLQIGSKYSVILPSHEIVTATLMAILGDEAGIRLKGWKLMRVPISSLIPLLQDAE